MDPAFEAHALPVVRWATADWEGWADIDAMDSAAADAWPAGAAPPRWNKVAGPAAATLARIGWSWPNGRTFIDDINVRWSVFSESPAAIRAAVS